MADETHDAAWDTAYGGLSARAALLYRLLAGHPGPHLRPEAAAAALGEGAAAADHALDELDRCGLLDLRLDGRLHLRGPRRAHARRCARVGAEAEADAGRRRTVRWHLRQAQRADGLLPGRRIRLAEPVPPLGYAPDLPLAGGRAARCWLERERAALLSCVPLAYELGEDADAWALCEALWALVTEGLEGAVPVAEAHRPGVAAAARAGHAAAEAWLRCRLAHLLGELGRPEEARSELAPALRVAGDAERPGLVWSAVRETARRLGLDAAGRAVGGTAR